MKRKGRHLPGIRVIRDNSNFFTGSSLLDTVRFPILAIGNKQLRTFTQAVISNYKKNKIAP